MIDFFFGVGSLKYHPARRAIMVIVNDLPASINTNSGRTDSCAGVRCIRSMDWCSQQLVLDASQQWNVISLVNSSIHRWLLDVESTKGSSRGSVRDLVVCPCVRVDDCESDRRHTLGASANGSSWHVEPIELELVCSCTFEPRTMVRIRTAG